MRRPLLVVCPKQNTTYNATCVFSGSLALHHFCAIFAIVLAGRHFADVRKMVVLGSGAQREIDDYMLH